MWNTDEKIRNRKVAVADGGFMEQDKREAGKRSLSSAMAMIIGAAVTLELMVAGAMLLNFDFRGADFIALVFVFMVLYFGVVAVLADK